MKYLITLLLFNSLIALQAQQVTTLATIPTNYGDGMILSAEGDILVSGGYMEDTILRITPAGVVSNFISGLPGPVGLGFDTADNLYVANYSGNSISKITPNVTVTEFASGLDGPAGLIVSENDEIFVTLYGANLSGNGITVLKFNLDGTSEEYGFITVQESCCYKRRPIRKQ
jgi:DNA-binding beta-propeller fold protein YncE